MFNEYNKKPEKKIERRLPLYNSKYYNVYDKDDLAIAVSNLQDELGQSFEQFSTRQ